MFSNHSDINKMIDTINEMNKGVLTGCHGRYHAMFVVRTVEYILQSLSYDARMVEMGKIAALLHDIGNIAGRNSHARKGAALASVFLDDAGRLSPEERDIIVHAIRDHSEGKSISSAVGAALLIADKVHVSKERLLPTKNVDDWHKNLLEVENVDLQISDKSIIINYITTEAFCKDLLMDGYEKGFYLPIKAAEFLGCSCHFQFNGVNCEKVLTLCV
ncbi:MAG: HD domain-containing protein [Defluviitaleaceae bacterium]|nr:HD domain-containing protein [Defluviitaleaceae bacterium]